ERDHAGQRMVLLHYSAPQRAGLLHADPHPGNFRMLEDGRLGVVDFGACARLPGGTPEPLGVITRLAIDGDTEGLLGAMPAENCVRPGIKIDAQKVLDFLQPITEPLKTETFTFSRKWMRTIAAAVADPRREEAKVGLMLNLPPAYMLIHRVTLG